MKEYEMSIQGLFADAKDAGNVSQASLTTLNAPDVGQMIQKGLGVDATSSIERNVCPARAAG